MSDQDPRADLPVPNRRPTGEIGARGGTPRRVLEPTGVYEPPPPRRGHGDPTMRKDLGLVVFVAASLVIGLVTWNLAGVVTSQALSPRASQPAQAVVGPSVRPSPSASSAASPSPSAAPTPSATPRPVRKPVTVKIESRPAAAFATEARNTWCAAAAVQIALNVNGRKVDTTRSRQARIRDLQVTATTRKDSRNGGAGPQGMVTSLNRLGKVDYELRIYDTRADALRGAAAALTTTGHSAILLAWRGAHAWVMTGFKANADPVVFKNAKVSGAYIIDPWYPRVSKIWGPSDKPGGYQNAGEMKRNYLPWRRPEGRYPARDGRFLAIVPVN